MLNISAYRINPIISPLFAKILPVTIGQMLGDCGRDLEIKFRVDLTLDHGYVIRKCEMKLKNN